jgi:hypothetical protein
LIIDTVAAGMVDGENGAVTIAIGGTMSGGQRDYVPGSRELAAFLRYSP